MIRRFVAALVVLTLVFAAPIAFAGSIDAKSAKKAMQYCQKGERMMKAGRLDAAAKQYDRAVKIAPEFPAAHIGLGQLAMAAQDFPRALQHFERARDGYAALGDALKAIESERYASARKQIEALQDSLVQGSQATAGFDNLDRSRIENQIARLQAIEAPSSEPLTEAPGEIFFYIGNAHWRLGHLEEALEAWETCVERSPKFAMVHNNLALAYWKKGNPKRGLEELEVAEKLGFPVNPKMRADLEKAAQ